MELPKGIRLLTLDREKLGRIWEELRDFCWYLGEGNFSDPVFFTKVFYSPTSLVFESDYGYWILQNITPGKSAEAHLPFLDHKLSPHTDDVKAMILWVFLTYDIVRLETMIYSFQKAVRRFLTEKVGFKLEGVLRKKAFLRGKWQDVETYSILREEVLDGN